MIRKSNNIFEIHFDQNNTVKLSAKNNIERDVIGMTLRSIAGEKVMERLQDSSDEENPSAEDQNEGTTDNYEKIEESKEKEDKTGEYVLINEAHEKSEKSPKTPHGMSERHIYDDQGEKKNLSVVIERKNSGGFGKTSVSSAKLQSRASFIKRTSTGDYEFLMKLEQLNREIAKQAMEKDILKQEQILLSEKFQCLEAQNHELSEQIKAYKQNFNESQRENEELKKKLESFLSQKHFYLQEIDIYKAESLSKDEIMDQLKMEMNKLMPSNPNKHKLTWMEVEEMKRNLEDSHLKISTLKKEKQDLQEKLSKSKECLDELTHSHEEIINELNYLRKKCESLAQEKSLVPPTPRREEEDIRESHSNSLMRTKEKSRENTQEDEEKLENSMITPTKKVVPNGIYQSVFNGVEEENKKLKEQIKQLEITIETLKITLSQEVNGKKSGKRLSRTNTIPLKIQSSNGKSLIFNGEDVQFLQKLANSLTETIADRELALENQKNINKELIKRLYDLEDKLQKTKKAAIFQNL